MIAALPWQPLDREPDPLTAAVATLVRSAVLPIAPIGVGAPDRDDVRPIELADGRSVRAVIDARPAAPVMLGARAALAYLIEGRGIAEPPTGSNGQGAISFRFSGRAVLDRRTQAFLELTVDLAPIA